MLITPPMAKAYVKLEPIDFRKGIDSLVALTERVVQKNPRCGAAFVFCNTKKTSIKVLYYDQQGYWLCQKRFSTGGMKNWPKAIDNESTRQLNLHELLVLLFDGNLKQVDFKKVFHVEENLTC